MMIIDITQPEFEDMPPSLDGEVLLERSDAGVLTLPQEIAYCFALTSSSQRAKYGYTDTSFDGLDTLTCNKPTPEQVAEIFGGFAQERLNALSLPDAAKNALQNRIDNLLSNAQGTADIDAAIEIALQLDDDIYNS